MRKSGNDLNVQCTVLDLLPVTYRVVFDDTALPELMTRMGQALGAEWSVILAHPVAGGAPYFAAATGIPPQAQRDYDARFHALEPWPDWSIRAGVPFGTPGLSHEMASAKELRQLEYYHDFWRPHSDLLHTAGSLFTIDSERFGHIAFPRARRFGEYGETTKALIAALTPHLGAALNARFILEQAGLRQSIIASAFDTLEDPVLLCDKRGRIEFANQAADSWLLQSNDAKVAAGRLTLRSQHLQDIADGFFRTLASGAVNGVANRSLTCVLDAEEAIMQMTALVSAPSNTRGTDSAWGGMIRISFPNRALQLKVEQIADRHALTVAERCVCGLLLKGLSPKAISEARGISLETVRSQVKSLYFKTGCRNHAELLAMLQEYRSDNATVKFSGSNGDPQRVTAERTRELEESNTALRRAYAEIELASLTDPLTGLGNRRFLVNALAGESLKTGTEARCAYLLIDIDHFKFVNDSYGHAAGDVVLIGLGKILRAQCRPGDLAARWGGEEFLMRIQAADEAQALALAERVRAAVENAVFALEDGRELRRTCSIGVACSPFVIDHPLSWEQVLLIADGALYLAKRGGRNAAICLTSGGELPAGFEQKLAQDAQAMIDAGILLAHRCPDAGSAG